MELFGVSEAELFCRYLKLLSRRLSVAAIADLVVSRRKSIVALEKEVEEFKAQVAKAGEASPAGVALRAVIKVKEQRLVKLREELKGFESLLPTSNQTSIPGTEPKRR